MYPAEKTDLDVKKHETSIRFSGMFFYSPFKVQWGFFSVALFIQGRISNDGRRRKARGPCE